MMDSDSDFKSDGYMVLWWTYHIAQTRISTSYFCTGQESESEWVYGNENEPLHKMSNCYVPVEVKIELQCECDEHFDKRTAAGPILSIKVPVTIGTILAFDRDKTVTLRVNRP